MAWTQKKAHKLFYDVESRQFLIVNNFLAILTLISILGIILETVAFFEKYSTLFHVIEYTTVAFFTLEYVGRIVANKKDIYSYIFSFFGFIDLLAIVPSYFGLTNLTFLKSARVLRILRLLRIIRLAKISRLVKQHSKEVEDYAYLYKLNVKIYFLALFSSIIIFGSVIYVIEDARGVFANIPLGMLWAAKILMGGITQQIPSTPLGELISVLGRFTGLALFGLLISLTGTTIKKLIFGTKEVEIQ